MLIWQSSLADTLPFYISAFPASHGGEGFEIYHNDKTVFRQFGTPGKTKDAIDLSSASASDKITVTYHHCGRTGKNSVISIRDASDKLLKTFRYPDATTGVSAMEIRMHEVLAVAKKETLKLYHTSSEFPNGRTLASLLMGPAATARTR